MEFSGDFPLCKNLLQTSKGSILLLYISVDGRHHISDRLEMKLTIIILMLILTPIFLFYVGTPCLFSIKVYKLGFEFCFHGLAPNN
jgi:hypothetical protein